MKNQETTINQGVDLQKEKIEALLKKGYNLSFLQLMSDPKFAHVRFTLDELLFLESLVGKQIETFRGITTIEKVQSQVVGCAIFYKGGCSTVSKEYNEIVFSRTGKPLSSRIKL